MQQYYENDVASSLGSKSYDIVEGGGGDAMSHAGPNPGPNALPRLLTAGEELESLCRTEISGGHGQLKAQGFPPTCLPIVGLLSGNHCCCDCGDEDRDHLRYASIGYGTLLCQDCAHRHITMSEEESRIKSLDDDRWNLRSTLTLLEGGNGNMLDYIKHKPRWRPPKNKSGDAIPEDVLAFQLIYLSKAAGVYRKELLHRVDDVFYGQITGMRKLDAKEEERLEKIQRMTTLAADDPFTRLFADKMPGLLDTSHTMTAGGGFNNNDFGDVPAVAKMRKIESKGRNVSTPLTEHAAPSIDLIKERINTRRNMNYSIRMERTKDFDGADILEDSFKDGILPPSSSDKPASKRMPQGSRIHLPSNARRRATVVSGGMVGEVGGLSIQEHDDHYSAVGGAHRVRLAPQKWASHQHGDDQTGITGISYASRSRAPPVGVYQRLDNSGGA